MDDEILSVPRQNCRYDLGEEIKGYEMAAMSSTSGRILKQLKGFVDNIKEIKLILRFKYRRGNITTDFEGMGFKYMD